MRRAFMWLNFYGRFLNLKIEHRSSKIIKKTLIFGIKFGFMGTFMIEKKHPRLSVTSVKLCRYVNESLVYYVLNNTWEIIYNLPPH